MAEYIEKEAILKAILDLPPKMDEQGYGWLGRRGVWQMLLDFPAADVAPVRHGRWTDKRTIEHDGEWYCSVCGEEITIYMGPERPDRYLYCPNCGAKMDGDTG